MNGSKILAVSVGLCYEGGDDFSTFSDAIRAPVGSNENTRIDETILSSTLLQYMEPNKSRRIDRVSKMGIVASQQCLQNSRIDVDDYRDDIGVVICTTFGAVASSKEFMLTAIQNGELAASPLIFPYTVPNAATGTLTIEAGLRGFNTTISGSNPICYVFDLLKLNRAKVFLTGGIEELALSDVIIGEDSTKALLDADYKIGEGAAMILLTTSEFAAANNLAHLFEICSVGTAYSLDVSTHSIDNFDTISKSAVQKSMEEAISSAQLSKDDIFAIASLTFREHIKCEPELGAIKEIWEADLPDIYYPKDILGETFGASDTFNLLAAYSCLKEQKGKYILSNSHQIGGNISSTIIKVL